MVGTTITGRSAPQPCQTARQFGILTGRTARRRCAGQLLPKIRAGERIESAQILPSMTLS
jgi:hypothetical protein